MTSALPARFVAEIDTVARDNTSGAMALVRKTAEILQRYAAELPLDLIVAAGPY
jgi:hypothetical protein